eukprot:9548679-Alexandrium_andersonii.AAC.1
MDALVARQSWRSQHRGLRSRSLRPRYNVHGARARVKHSCCCDWVVMICGSRAWRRASSRWPMA